MNLYDRLRDDLKERLETEVKTEYPTKYAELVRELTNEDFYILLKFHVISDIWIYLIPSKENCTIGQVVNFFKN